MFGKKPTTPGGITPPPHTGDGAVPPATPGTELVATETTAVTAFVKAKTSVSQDAVVRVEYTDPKLETTSYRQAKELLIDKILDSMDFRKFEELSPDTKREKIRDLVEAHLLDIPVPLTAPQQGLLKEHTVDELLGFGPLEPLLQDSDVSDIMVNTANQVYVEKFGKLHLTDIRFTSERHLLNIIQRIVTRVGRRIDETSPMVDARMPDGSRFNAIIPPIALDGALVSIRKFKKNKMPLSGYVDYNSMSPQMVRFLEIASAIRLNIIISGGTGSGKTTLLNALSGHISVHERVVTIEDAAELQLHQPHVLRLETRPSNIEGSGEITQRQLVKNALRMRPDRIILGEIRGDEAVDVLAAMNTGHEGSFATIHANTPRDCLARMENLITLSGVNMSTHSVRYQIASALDLIIQISRMHDGKRRVTHIEEVVGMEGEVVTTQTIFSFKAGSMTENGDLTGEFQYSGIRPRFVSKAAFYGKEKDLMDALRSGMKE